MVEIPIPDTDWTMRFSDEEYAKVIAIRMSGLKITFDGIHPIMEIYPRDVVDVKRADPICTFESNAPHRFSAWELIRKALGLQPHSFSR